MGFSVLKKFKMQTCIFFTQINFRFTYTLKILMFVSLYIFISTNVTAQNPPPIQWSTSFAILVPTMPLMSQQESNGNYKVITTSDGVAYDVTSAHGGFDIWFAKTDPVGKIIWNKSYGGTYNDDATSFDTLNSSELIIGGRTESRDGDFAGNTTTGAFLLKLDTAGNVIWQKGYSGYTINSVKHTSDGGIVATGASTDNKVYILKVDLNGNVLWEKSYGGISGVRGESGCSIIETRDGMLFVGAITGNRNSGDVIGGHGNTDFWGLKLNSSGDKIWAKAYGGSDFDVLKCMIQTRNGDFVLTGYSMSTDGDVKNNLGRADVWVVRIDSLGNIVWESTYGGLDTDIAFHIIENSDESLVFAAESSSIDADPRLGYGQDMWVVKIDKSGTPIWQKDLGPGSGLWIESTNDGGYIFQGSYGQDMKLIKFGTDICPTVSFFKDTTNVCSTSYILDAGSGYGSYLWSTGAISQTITASQNGMYKLTATSSGGCVYNDSTYISLGRANLVSDFTVNLSSQCLSQNLFATNNISTFPSGTMSYSWTFGNGDSSNLTSPSVSYASAGTYNIKLVVTSDQLCKDSITKQVIVVSQPAVPIITSSSQELCTGSTLTLSTDGLSSLQWYKNNVLISGASASTYLVTQGADYKVITKNSSGCESTSTIKTILENPLPTGILDVPTNTVVCEGVATQLVAKGSSSYQWYFNNTAISGATSSTYNALQSGVYAVDFISNKACSNRSMNSVTLSLIQKPQASFTYNSYCTLIPTVLNSTSTVANSGLVKYTWNLGNGITGAGQSFTYTFTQPSVISAKLVVTPTACPQLADSLINILALETSPAGISYPIVNAVLNKPKTLSARPIGVSYSWLPSTDLSSPYLNNPVLTATAERFYKIYITNQAGCVIIDTQQVKIFKDRDIYVPKAFTPNNDGQNDLLYPIPVGIREMTVFRVYNRWGGLVYDNKTATSSTGWDGTYNGKPLPLGTYAWIAEGIDDDGNLVHRTGNTVLVR